MGEEGAEEEEVTSLRCSCRGRAYARGDGFFDKDGGGIGVWELVETAGRGEATAEYEGVGGTEVEGRGGTGEAWELLRFPEE